MLVTAAPASVATAAAPKPLASVKVDFMEGPRVERTQVVAGEKSVTTSAPLEQAIAYASSLVSLGYAKSMGVLQAAEGWKLVALEGTNGGFPLDFRGAEGGISRTVQRHTYDLAAVVGSHSYAVWNGKERVSQVLDLTSPVVLPPARNAR